MHQIYGFVALEELCLPLLETLQCNIYLIVCVHFTGNLAFIFPSNAQAMHLRPVARLDLWLPCPILNPDSLLLSGDFETSLLGLSSSPDVSSAHGALSSLLVKGTKRTTRRLIHFSTCSYMNT